MYRNTDTNRKYKPVRLFPSTCSPLSHRWLIELPIWTGPVVTQNKAESLNLLCSEAWPHDWVLDSGTWSELFCVTPAIAVPHLMFPFPLGWNVDTVMSHLGPCEWRRYLRVEQQDGSSLGPWCLEPPLNGYSCTVWEDVNVFLGVRWRKTILGVSVTASKLTS